MAEDDRSKFAMQVAGRAESGYPKILATDDDGNLKVKLSFNPSPGIDHTASGIKFTDTAGESLVFGNLCYMKSDGKWWKADADAIATMPGLALALATIAADADGVFLKMGFARDDTWNWTAGGALYASTVAGGLTQTAPSGSGDIVQKVGFALTADIFYFKPSLSLLDAEPVDGSIARGIPSNWAYDHAADFDAHTLNPVEQVLIGGYLGPLVAGASDNQTLSQYRLYAILLWVSRDMTFDRIATHVETADSGKDARLGIYGHSDLYPTTLLKDCGTVDLDATGTQELIISPSLKLTKGYYFLAAITDSDGIATFTKALSNVPCAFPLGVTPTSFDYAYAGYYINQASGQFAALPTFPAGATLSFGIPIIALRVASLD